MLYKLLVILFLIGFSAQAKAESEVYFDGSRLVVKESNDTPKTARNKRYKSKKSRPSKASISKKYVNTSSKKSGGKSHLIRWKGHRMPALVAEKLMEVERLYGPITIISSCRPGATVKNSGRPSMHSYCRAIDFNPVRSAYSAVANFLKRTWSGGVGTYSGRFNHIHIDDNRGRWHN